MKLYPLILTCVLSYSQITAAEEITIAVASNFLTPMKAIVQAFEANTGHKVNVAYSSSGKIFAQVNFGAPYHAFFSADQDKPSRLVDLGKAIQSTQFTYAIGKLVLWSPDPTAINGTPLPLQASTFRKLAIANPKLAPYGHAALEVLNQLDLTTNTRPKWVMGENIAQTYQFVATSNADLGFVALSQVAKDNQFTQGSGWIIPENLYSPIKQDAVILEKGKNSQATAELFRFVQTQTGKTLIESFGYETVNTH